MKARSSPLFLQELESRCMLAAVSFTDALVVNPVDHDGDGRLRAFDMHWIVAASGPGSASYYVIVRAQPVSGGASEVVLQSGVEVIQSGQSRTTSYTIRSDFFGVPQSGVDPREKFSLSLVDITNGTSTPLVDPDLADISMESGANDFVSGDSAPAITSFSATPNGFPAPLLVDTSVRFDLVTSGTAAIDSIIVFFDRDADGRVDASDLFAANSTRYTTWKLASPNGSNWAADFVVDADWSSGTIVWGAIAVDVNGNMSPISTITARTSQPPLVTGGVAEVMRSGGWTPITDAAQWFQPGYSFYYGETIRMTPTIATVAPIAHVYFIYDIDHSGGWTNGDRLIGEANSNTGDNSMTLVLDPAWGNPQPAASVIIDAVDVNGTWARQRGTLSFKVTDKPVVTAALAPPSAGAGQTMRLTASVSDYSPRAVTWFIDRLANQRFDPGVDIDLGADFDGSDGFSRDVVVQPEWAGRSVIMAAALDTDGAWSDTRSAGATWISAGPIVAFLTVIPPTSTLVAGQIVTVTAAVSAGVVLDGVTFFADLNSDGEFTPGVDRDLGADRNSSDGWSVTFTVPSNWSTSSLRFGANGFRGSTFGDFSTTTRSTYQYSAGPLIGGVEVPTSVTWGDRFEVFVTSIIGSDVRAVTFFYDVAGDGNWNPGVDTDLGADFDGSDGWSVSATARSTWAPTANGRITAHAVDSAGYWGATSTTSGAVVVYGVPRISNFLITPAAQNQNQTVNLGTSFSLSADIAASAGVRAITFFVDIDHDGSWTPGVDRDLGATFFSGSPTSVGGGVSSIFNFGRGTFSILADAVDTRGRWSLSRPVVSITVV